MPRNKTPCGARYGLIFRYITDALVQQGSIDKQTVQARKERNRLRSAEYDAVQTAYRTGGYSAVEKCLSEKSWLTPEKKTPSDKTFSETKAEGARGWLQQALQNGPVAKSLMSTPTGYLHASHALGLPYGGKPSLKALLKAAKVLGVTARCSGKRGGVFWHLPTHDLTAPTDLESQAAIDNAVTVKKTRAA
jgi:hypothetical protein